MRAAFYFDDNIAMKPLVSALRSRGILVVTSDESGQRGKPDEDHLAFAAARGLAVVTSDAQDFSELHWKWLQAARHHSGVVIVRQRTSIGDQVRGLGRVHQELTAEELLDALVYLSHFI